MPGPQVHRRLRAWSAAMREYVAIEDDNVALVPDGVALQDASIVACAIGTILNAMREVGRLAPGEERAGHRRRRRARHARGAARAPRGRLRGRADDLADKAEQIRALGAHEVIVHARGEDFSAAGQEGDRRPGRRRRHRQCRQPAVRSDPPQHGHRRPLDPDRTAHRAVRAVQSGAAFPQERLDAERHQHHAPAARGLPGAGRARRRQADHLARPAARAGRRGACADRGRQGGAGGSCSGPNG